MHDIDAPRTLYVSRLVELPPLTAAAAFDLVLPHRDVAKADALRTVSHRFALARIVTINVELELTRWSSRRCELGVRPMGRSVPFAGGWRHRRYLEVADALVTSVTAGMLSTVEQWHVLAWAEAVHPSRSAA
jgi:hypothetical protein